MDEAIRPKTADEQQAEAIAGELENNNLRIEPKLSQFDRAIKVQMERMFPEEYSE